jgi:hypothetical protein
LSGRCCCFQGYKPWKNYKLVLEFSQTVKPATSNTRLHNIIRLYETNLNYPVKLIVTDSAGCADTTSALVKW